ncbi:hypothetical protein J4Q44_G00170190 [Coregonus suidteri]|uniref:Uncharacterized protein n=1 Tax=Coregonus suidteri TaxID=861788 RepID=A0AAN8LHE4_9TELE
MASAGCSTCGSSPYSTCWSTSACTQSPWSLGVPRTSPSSALWVPPPSGSQAGTGQAAGPQSVMSSPRATLTLHQPPSLTVYLTSRPRSPPQPPPPPLPPGRPPPPTPPQERGTETELGGGGGGTAATAGGGAGEGVEDWEEREAPLRQLDGVEGEEREGGRARAIDNQYSFF